MAAIFYLLFLLTKWHKFLIEQLVNVWSIPGDIRLRNWWGLDVTFVRKVPIKSLKLVASIKNYLLFMVNCLLKRFHANLSQLRMQEMQALVPMGHLVIQILRLETIWPDLVFWIVIAHALLHFIQNWLTILNLWKWGIWFGLVFQGVLVTMPI